MKDKRLQKILVLWHCFTLILLLIGLYLHISEKTTTVFLEPRHAKAGLYTYSGLQVIILAGIFYITGMSLILILREPKRKRTDHPL